MHLIDRILSLLQPKPFWIDWRSSSVIQTTKTTGWRCVEGTHAPGGQRDNHTERWFCRESSAVRRYRHSILGSRYMPSKIRNFSSWPCMLKAVTIGDGTSRECCLRDLRQSGVSTWLSNYRYPDLLSEDARSGPTNCFMSCSHTTQQYVYPYTQPRACLQTARLDKSVPSSLTYCRSIADNE